MIFPPAPTPTLPCPPAGDVDAGVIEDARARQRRHRVAAVLALAVLAVLGLLLGASGGGHGGGSGGQATGGPSGSSSFANIGHATNAPAAAAVAACNWLVSRNGPPAFAGKPVLVDGLGRYTAAIYVSGREERTCISNGQHMATSVATNNRTLSFEPAPGPDQLGSPSGAGGRASGFAGANQEENVQGQAGSAISAVEFRFKSRSAVKATVRNGWYFAWWPGNTWPTSVTTTTGITRITSPMGVAACQAQPSRCVFAEPTAARSHATVSAGDEAAGLLPNGAPHRLQVAGALAVGPTGALYVADMARHRVLVRLPNGRFRVVAGTGPSGFSGDGRSALSAELSTVSGLAFSPAGSLYMVDGGRVRVVRPNGVISTVAGDGHAAKRITGRTPAHSVGLGTAAANAGPSIAFAPNGTLYIATMVQVLRLTGEDELQPVRAVVPAGPYRGPLTGLGHIAVDGRGNIDVSGVNGYSVWQIPPDGHAHEVGPGSGARQSGGDYSVLQRAPDGEVYAERGPIILRISPHHLVPAFTIRKVDSEYFLPTYFAIGHDETYLDEIPGDSGFEARQQLVVDRNGRVTLLWREANRGHGDSFGPR
jgi:hypothetical protein